MKNNLLIRIFLFFIIAIIISNLIRFDLFGLKEKITDFPSWISILTIVFLEGSGVFIGAVVAIRLMKKKKKISTMSVFGTSKSKSYLLLLIPVIALSVIGINNNFDLNSNLYGFIAGFGTFIYCVLEEYGWRGYLQDELTELKSWKRYLLIGFLWYLWHLLFLTNTSLQDNLIFFGVLVFGSWGIGQIAIATKSIIADFEQKDGF